MRPGLASGGGVRRAIALVLGALYIVGVVSGVFVLVLRPPPPPRVTEPPALPALTQHVLFVIVDGLRYDVATDALRMPRFAEAMRRFRSAEIYAGPISMTSAAVQNYGTGQRGRFAQIVSNINPDPPAYNSWIHNAAARGLTLAVAGDPVWIEMFGRSFQHALLDPPGVAMDADFNDQTFASTRTLRAKAPAFLVAHFVTPDHQGHVYGIPSARYSRHIHDFDAHLFQLLAEFPSDWTVLVTSDHGAADSGTHGADVPVQRRSPLFAYGTGIAGPAEFAGSAGSAGSAGQAATVKLEQSDLAGTLAALLGVPAAAHSQGHLLTSWLAVPAPAQADYGCADAARALTLLRQQDPSHAEGMAARLTRDCAGERPAEARRLAAEALVREVDATLTGAEDYLSPRASAFLLSSLLGACLVSALLLRPSRAAAASSLGLGLIAIVLVAGLEQLPGFWPKRVDGTLFVLFNLPSLLFLVAPEWLVAWLLDHPALAAAVVPGAFAVTYPANLAPVALAICLSASLVFVLSDRPEQWGISWRRDASSPRLLNLLLIAGWSLSLVPAGITASGAYSNLAQQLGLTLGLGLLLISSVAWVLVRRTPRAAQLFLGLTALAVISLLLRRVAPPWLGRPLLVGLPLLGMVLIVRRRVQLGLWLILTGYLWVSRDFEVLPVAGGLGIALLIGERFADMPRAAWNRGRGLIALGVLFCLIFLVRLGMSAGLEALSLDFGAGAFRDKNVSASWITFAVIWKYLIVVALLVIGFLRGVPRDIAESSVVGLIAISVCRAAVLLGMMQCARGSFWTSMRVMSDLPFALMFAVAAALLLPWVSARSREPFGV